MVTALQLIKFKMVPIYGSGHECLVCRYMLQDLEIDIYLRNMRLHTERTKLNYLFWVFPRKHDSKISINTVTYIPDQYQSIPLVSQHTLWRCLHQASSSDLCFYVVFLQFRVRAVSNDLFWSWYDLQLAKSYMFKLCLISSTWFNAMTRTMTNIILNSQLSSFLRSAVQCLLADKKILCSMIPSHSSSGQF